MWTCPVCGDNVDQGFEVCWSWGTSAAGVPDDEGLAGKFGSVAFFDGCVERVAIDVGDAEALQFGMGAEPSRPAAHAQPIDHLPDPAAASAQGAFQRGWLAPRHSATLPRVAR